MHVLLRNGKDTETIYKSPTEAIILFAETYWTPDEQKVAVIVTGFNSYQIAYDLEKKALMPLDSLKPGLVAAIAREYKAPQNEGLLRWTYSDDAQGQFRQRHPEAMFKDWFSGKQDAH